MDDKNLRAYLAELVGTFALVFISAGAVCVNQMGGLQPGSLAIALAAGLRRSTVYLHYKDKAEILAEVIAEYTPKARSILAMLPGPRPSLEQLNLWVRKVARFVAKELVPLSIILELRRTNQDVDALEKLTRELLAALGENNPPFREASHREASPMLRARGLMLLQELTYACEMHLSDTSDARGKALLKVAAQDFFVFLSNPGE